MKKMKLFSILLVFVMMLTCLSGCKSCEHKWEAATCKEPKTCKLCGETTGEPNEEHQWEEATTETPKTCSVCGLTEGDEILVDERFTTKACKEVFGTWTSKYEQQGNEAGIGNVNFVAKLTLTFYNNGEVRITSEPENPATLKNELTEFLRNMTYRDFETRGLTQADAESWSMSNYGKDVTTYCAERASRVVDAVTSTEDMVYYVEDGVIYIAEDWDSEMIPSSYELKDNTMMLNYGLMNMELEMTRIGGKK